MEITLHFINIKKLKFAYMQNRNKLAGALVAYLWEEMWWLQASKMSSNEAWRPIYYREKVEHSDTTDLDLCRDAIE